MELNNKIAVVTGANKGIGQTISKKLEQNGAIVIGTATSKHGINIINNYLNKKCKGIILDITNPNQIKQAIKKVFNLYGSIDILINNAAIHRDNLLLKMSTNDWLSVLNTNLNSIFFMTKNVLPYMIKQKKGRIITIGSIIGNTGNCGQVNYSASKSGIIGFSKSLALEVASKGITVNIISPGYINTGMTNKIKSFQKKKYMLKIPMKKFGTSNDIANAVIFLASDNASYITGETLHVNGGLYMK